MIKYIGNIKTVQPRSRLHNANLIHIGLWTGWRFLQGHMFTGENMENMSLVCGKCLELLCFAVIGQFYEF